MYYVIKGWRKHGIRVFRNDQVRRDSDGYIAERTRIAEGSPNPADLGWSHFFLSDAVDARIGQWARTEEEAIAMVRQDIEREVARCKIRLAKLEQELSDDLPSHVHVVRAGRILVYDRDKGGRFYTTIDDHADETP